MKSYAVYYLVFGTFSKEDVEIDKSKNQVVEAGIRDPPSPKPWPPCWHYKNGMNPAFVLSPGREGDRLVTVERDHVCTRTFTSKSKWIKAGTLYHTISWTVSLEAFQNYFLEGLGWILWS